MRIIDSPKHRAQALVLALGIAILIALAPFATGLLGAAVLHVIFVPLHRRLSRHISAGLAAATVTTIAAIVLLLPIVWLVGSAVYEAPDILRSLQKSSFQQRLSALRIADVAVGTQIAEASGALFTWVSGQALRLLDNAARAALDLVIALFSLYYMLSGAHAMWQRVRKYIPFSSAGAETLRYRF